MRAQQRLLWTLGSLLFAASLSQRPPYTGDQNTYLLHGLAQAGYGWLNRDWLANCTDHIPFFTALVSWSYRTATPVFFYFVYGALAALYAWCLLHLIHVSTVERPGILVAAWIAVLLLHVSMLPPLASLASTETSSIIGFLATNGLADQQILCGYLHPCAFGVFLLLGLVAFLQDRLVLAVLWTVTAATFHPTYLLHSGLLVGAFILVALTERRPRSALAIGSLSAFLVGPILYYVWSRFSATDPQTHARALEILVDERFPHHAKPSQWFGLGPALQLAWIGLGIICSRKNRRLFLILVSVSLSAGALAIVQILTGSRSLAVLFPWRSSVWLVPAATALITGSTIAAINREWLRWLGSKRFSGWSERVRGVLWVVAFSIPLLTVGMGLRQTVREFQTARQLHPVAEFVRSHSQAGEIYLIPVELEWFRLTTGSPIFVDWKSHPYLDSEVLEWYRRVELARAFYSAPDQKSAENALGTIRARSNVTHLIVGRDAGGAAATPRLELVYDGLDYRVFRLGR